MLRLAACGLILLCSQELPVLVREDFEKGAGRWEFSDPNAWKIEETPKRKFLSLFEKTIPKTPHKSPLAIALLKESASATSSSKRTSRARSSAIPSRILA